MKRVIESAYPIDFRKEDAEELGMHLKNGGSVSLVGMKRVGISNFLRFFLYHADIEKTYIHNGTPHLFVHVDLNDLVERSIPAFWTLLLTRVVDSVQNSDIPEAVKRKCRRLFVQSIQLKDLFFTIDCVQKVLDEIVGANRYPTLFLLRFDRLAEVITPEFFSNLHGLRAAVKNKISFVFTSFRSLHELAPDVFKKQHLSVFAHDMFLTPANAGDLSTILSTLEDQYHTKLMGATRDALIELSGGYVQYLQLAVIRLSQEKTVPGSRDALFTLLVRDEQVTFQSEELFESLTKAEKEALLAIKQEHGLGEEQRNTGQYLWNTGMVVKHGKNNRIFSPLFDEYLGRVTSATRPNGGEFTKKEHLLYTHLKAHENELCEREAIIEAVWPENKDLGVSDWAIDRLVARLRSKLKAQGSSFQILTVVTRGYKLVAS